MTPRTRSGGGPPPPSSIVYKSEPTLKQVQFPSRRKRVRTYGQRERKRAAGGGDEDGHGSNAHTTPALKQKTLTQYDFSSSFNDEDIVELSDASDVDDADKIGETDETDKENIEPTSAKRNSKEPASSSKRRTRRQGGSGNEDEEEARVPDTEEEDSLDGEEEPVAGKRRRVRCGDGKQATKRRRTLGEEHRVSTMRESKTSSRRRTLGDLPMASSSRARYHTQTLTQFIGRTTSFVADSEDEEELGGRQEDDGFLEWLGDDEPQSPTMGVQASISKREPVTAAAGPGSEENSPSPQRRTRRRPMAQTGQQSREESVVPQTPAKSIRFNLPPSAQHISPSPSRIAAVYGAPNQYKSPSSRRQSQASLAKSPLTELVGKPRKRMSPASKPQALVIQDSYATDGWSSVGGSQLRHCTPSQTRTEVFSTPAEEAATIAATAGAMREGTPDPHRAEMPPPQPPTQTQDGQNEEFFGAMSQIIHDSASASPQRLPTTPSAVTTRAASLFERQEIPDSDEEEDGEFDDATSDANDDDGDNGGRAGGGDESLYAAGAETQLLMDQLQSSVQKWSRTPRRSARNAPSSSAAASPHPPRTCSSVPSPSSANTPQSVPPSSSAKPPPPPAAATTVRPRQHPGVIANDIPRSHHASSPPLRRPLHRPEPLDTQGAPLESQRVALATLQGFTPASARTDILLPLSGATLANLLSGHQDAVVLPFKVPAQVVRFWLINDGLLRYLASVSSSTAAGGNSNYDPEEDNGRGGRGTWAYHITQLYELNNPVQEQDMRAEDWIHGQVARYVYFPPAVVSQLLWNLRQAMFSDVDDGEAHAASSRTAAAAAILSSSPQQQRPPPPPPSKKPTPRRRHQQRQQKQQPTSSPLQATARRARRPPPSTMPAPPPPPRPSRARENHTQPQLVRPSQATTASQASTIDVPASLSAAAVAAPLKRHADGSSESLVFDDHGGSSISMPYSAVALGDQHLDASQLLTNSQTLPESLVRDEERMPDEIEDSEDE